MKLLILSVLLGVALADVSHIVGQNPDSNAKIIRQEQDIGVPGGYQYVFENDNGISAQEQGQLKDVGGETPAQVAQGAFQYTSPEGQIIRIEYVADENGFQPRGEHLPTPPPIPADIIKGLEFIRANPPAPQTQQ